MLSLFPSGCYDKRVAELDFNRTQQRGLSWPLILAALLAAAVAWFLLHPPPRVRVEALSATAVPTRTVFAAASGSGEGATLDGLYVVAALKVHNGLGTPLTPESFTLTLTDAQGAVLDVPAARKDDVVSLRTSFPKLETLLARPLYRETNLAPGTDSAGSIVFDMKVSEETWRTRQAAVVKVGFYHQDAVTVTLPKP